ncbi:MAG TPA: protein kinase, partial [Polyangiaceae bacterium]|nr:protein kinase [Polyangiaceae bacterium]
TENLPELVERFRREALVGAHARHPHVAAATDFGTLDDGSYFLVLEHVRGVTLHEIVRRGPLAPARAVHVARQLAAALDSLHARGIMHRDVKPHNVMIVNPTGRETAEGEELSNDDTVGPDFVKLIDFGLATVELERLTSIEMTVEAPPDSSPPARLTGSGAIFGTLAYLAPEAALGMDAVDARGDLYALGVVIYEMLTGRRPFTGETAADVIAQHVSAPPPPFAEVVPELYIPASLERITLRLLAKDPAERFQRGADVVAALAAALAEISARVTHDTPATLRKIPTRGPWPLPDPSDSAPPGAPPELPSAPPRAQASAPPRVQASGPPRAQVSAPPPLPPVSALPAAPPPRPSAPVPVPPPRLPMPTPPPRPSAPVPAPRLPMPTPPPRQSAPVPMPGLPTPPPRPSAPSLQGALPAPPAAAKSGASAPSLPRADEMPELAPLSNPTLGVESSEFDDIVSEAPGRTTQAMMPIAPDELGPDPGDAVEPTTLAMMPVASDQLGLEPPSHPTLAIAPRVPDEYGLVPPSLPTLAMEPSPFAAPPVRAAPDTIVTPPPSASSYDLASPAPEADASAPRGGLPSPSPLAYVAALLLPVLAAALYLAFSRGPKPPEPEVTVAEAPVEAT